MATTDCRPVAWRATALRVMAPILDADGDLVTGATSPDSEISKDQGTFTDCTNEIAEIATASGIYYLDLTASEMTCDGAAVIIKTSTSGAKTTPLVIYPQDTGDIRVDLNSVNGVLMTARQVPEFGIIEQGTASAFTGADITFQTSHGFSSNTINGSIVVFKGTTAGTEYQTGVILSSAGDVFTLKNAPVELPTGVITYRVFPAPAAGLDTAIAQIANIYDAFELFGGHYRLTSAAVANITAFSPRDVIGTGSATTGGTPSSFIDTARSEPDGTFVDCMVIFKSGTNAKFPRRIGSYIGKAFTFKPDLPASVGNGDTYDIVPNTAVILSSLIHTGATIPNVTTTGSLNGHTPQTGDNFARLGAPAGASVSFDIAAIAAQTGNIAAIKSKTDALPAVPANESTVLALAGAVVTIGSQTAAIASVKAKTDQLQFSIAGFIDGNVKRTRDQDMAGSGTEADPWRAA